jgi:hypothetical protein
MAEDHPPSDRGRALEEDYFRNKDRELLEKMRQASTAEAARRELSATSGLQDPKLLDELQALGFTPDTVPLLFFAPLVQVAWADGEVSDAERTVIVRLARARGIDEGSAADRQLAEWLVSSPAPEVLAGAQRLIRAILDDARPEAITMSAEELVKHCEEIAAASGGVFGLRRVSSEERALLETLARDLGRKQS